MKLILRPNELILKAGNARLYQDNQVKGKLIVTTQGIYFIALKEQYRQFDIKLIYSEISELDYFNTFWIIPNGLIIKTKDNKNISLLTTNNRNNWSDLITKMI